MICRINAKLRLLVSVCFVTSVLTIPGTVAMFGQSNPAQPSTAVGSVDSHSANAYTFDVATMRLVDSLTGDVAIVNPPRSESFSAINITAKRLVQIAYGLNGFQISGGPKWFSHDGYNVQAKADRVVYEELQKLSEKDAKLQKQRMLQALLKDRMGLEVHSTTKELPAYALTVDKKGLKLHESEVRSVNAQSSGKLPADKDNNSSLQTQGGPKGLKIEARGISMETLAVQLSGQLGIAVVDRTDLKGNYDFTLQWSPEATKAALSTDSNDVSQNSPNPSGPTMFDAVSDQLGLKITPSKAMLEVLVIDQISRPTAN